MTIAVALWVIYLSIAAIIAGLNRSLTVGFLWPLVAFILPIILIMVFIDDREQRHRKQREAGWRK